MHDCQNSAGAESYNYFTIGNHRKVNRNPCKLFEATMILFNAFRDFADGLSRGVSLFFTQRHDHVERSLMPGRIHPRHH